MNNCGHCGANLTPADMSQPTCRYCGTVLAHYARAAEKVAVVNALMGDANRNGIPDVLEGAARMGGPPLAMPPGGAQPVVVVHSAVVMGGQPLPPMTGGPVGNPGFYGAAMHGQPQRSGAGMLIAVLLVAVVVVAIGAGMAAFLVLA
jgi:hypothetical protein